MDRSFDAEVSTLRSVAATASGTRELAHARIVGAFRAQLEGAGPGPTDADLESFARLVRVERALVKELGTAVVLAAAGGEFSDGGRARHARGDAQSPPR